MTEVLDTQSLESGWYIPNQKIGDPTEDLASPENWGEELAVTAEEMKMIFARLKERHRIPCLDDVPSRVWHTTVSEIGNRFRHVFTCYLKEDVFSLERAKLVLLKKEDNLFAYRSICLFDEGKMLECVIVGGIVGHMSQKGLNLFEGQCGFQEGRSIIDTIRFFSGHITEEM